MAVELEKSVVVGLFADLGFKTADKWDNDRIIAKMKQIDSVIDEDTQIEDEEKAKCLKTIMKAVKKHETITLIESAKDQVPEDEPAPAKKPKAKAKPEPEDEPAPAKKPKAKAKPEPEDEPAPAKKPESDQKKKIKVGGGRIPGNKAGPPDSPGIIKLLEMRLKEASERSPVTKEALLEMLIREFPDRDADKMASTINTQVPSRFRDYGFLVNKNQKGYWITED